MEPFPVDIDPKQIVRWIMAEHRIEPSSLKIVARRTAEERQIPARADLHLGDEEREDLSEIAAMTKLSPERVVAVHSGATYRVYMYGFSPGFCYLGGVPPEIQVSRRVTPRPPHPANTVLLGGGLTLVSTFSMPTGWWLIGRTPERMFAPARKRAFLVDVGDALRFSAVDRATFDALEARAAAGEIVAKQEKLR